MRYPWRWTLPALLVIAATVVLGVVRYPSLAGRIPVHFGLDGVPDRLVATTVFSAFAPVLIQVVLTLVLAGSAALALRGRPAVPRVRLALCQALLFLAACDNLAFFFLASAIWGGSDLRGFEGIAAGLAFVAGIGGLVWTVARAQREAPAPTGGDPHWRAGMFYVNPDDPALLVPRRNGLGLTINLGRPAGKLILAALIVLPVLSILVSLM